jgi:hypothetical protein
VTEGTEPDFVARTFAKLDHATDAFHDTVMRPILLAGRTVAYAFLLFIAVVVIVVALLIATDRLLNVYVFAGHPWATDLVMSALFVAIGAVIWRWRRPAARS